MSLTVPHNKVGTTTVGKIRAAGGDVVPSPTKNNSNHATLKGVSSKEASELFKVQSNPKKKK